MKGLVFNLQRYSLHDGPGIRTIVFLKGCPLRCPWCSNPESQAFVPEVILDGSKCIREAGCHFCEDVCAQGALRGGTLDRVRCTGCGSCFKVCPSKALHVYGEELTVEEVLSAVEREAAFYAHGDGGITLSGGEPFAQGRFAAALLREARRRRIHTNAETCGCCDTEVLRECAGYLDYIMYDIKSMDGDRHRQVAGKGNGRILANLEMLFAEFPALHKHIRTPVIPGFNDSDADIRAIAAFLRGRKNYTYELLPYHRFGTGKYGLLGRAYSGPSEKLDEALFLRLKKYEAKG